MAQPTHQLPTPVLRSKMSRKKEAAAAKASKRHSLTPILTKTKPISTKATSEDDYDAFLQHLSDEIVGYLRHQQHAGRKDSVCSSTCFSRPVSSDGAR